SRRLLQPDMFSGWGIRTMSKSAVAYNPMSYHNGTVWPHDNALIAAGLKRYGYHKQTNRIATAIFDAAVFVDYMRLPELFCGFTRRTPNQPVSYPVACSPQAWAAGSPFLLLRSEEHTSELQSPCNLVCRLLLEKKKTLQPQDPRGGDIRSIVRRSAGLRFAPHHHADRSATPRTHPIAADGASSASNEPARYMSL